MNLYILLAVMMFPSSNVTAKISVQVLDGETLQPIPSVSVACKFFRQNGRRHEEKIQQTDEYGRSAFTGRTRDGHVDVGIAKAPSGYHVPIGSFSKWWNRWNEQEVYVPDNVVVTQYLSKVGNPIPLCVCEKCCHGSEPQFAKNANELRFDLMKGDWLPPNGVGQIADVIFRKLPCEANGRHRVVATFPGDGNGVQVIANPGRGPLRLRQAPEDGFKGTYEMWYLKQHSNAESETVLAFRIRTKKDEAGRVIDGYYGKIYDGLRMEDVNVVNGAHSVKMLFYLNPNSRDRNLEWDCKKNLSPNPNRNYILRRP